LSTGALIGIIIASIFVCLIIIAIITFLMLRNKGKMILKIFF